MKVDKRDLTIGEFQDNCDVCTRWEDECDELLFDLYVTSDVHMILCKDCLTDMEKLLSRVVTVKEPA